MKFSKREILDLIKAWFVISLAFAVLYQDSMRLGYLSLFIVCLFTVGLGFLLHELAHKSVAERYGFFAEFVSFDFMLFIALIGSLFGFIFAAPGAVFIHGNISKKKNGIISVAGPIMNIILAIIFFVMLKINLFNDFSDIGFRINSYLALFNMLPIFMLDGQKVWSWNKGIFFVIIGISVILMLLQFI